jgi:hypothetical protein
VNTRNSQCNGQPNNNNNNNNAHLAQLLTTQTQLMQAMLQTLNHMQPNQQQVPHHHHRTSPVWRSSCELTPPPSHNPKTPWTQKIGSRGLRRNS